MSQGLRIAPPEAPVVGFLTIGDQASFQRHSLHSVFFIFVVFLQTGYMFGKGVYFADMVSKSANYCHTSQSEPVGLLLLAEVALGNM